MKKIKQITMLVMFIILSLFISGCTTIKESRGDTLEDTRKLIFDVQTGLRNLDEKTSVIPRTLRHR